MNSVDYRGIGPKSAQRIAFHLLKLPKGDAQQLATAIVEVKERIGFCEKCWNISEGAFAQHVKTLNVKQVLFAS
ncbi:MAG: hypothetical protein Ct9H300mP26_1980 [Acidimicrobiales bacterium]|nr:MAG: hypothetical protein Ct9H300mP26_1980 [Acidimicrobiales bacterium]